MLQQTYFKGSLLKVPASQGVQRRVSCRVPLQISAQNKNDKSPSLQATMNTFFKKYDFVTAGVGSLACTTYFVLKGQDIAHGLMITVFATITALVVEEYCFKQHE
eukprot:TRINITY_DN35784_c0_g1_i1.p5 TRINITY_DN35784_c0_g1~~TRINITY_DN35784_c0_g1_i1.p5  ORF type:complete len:105 (-),score=2.75 TRINITY_DN35784_c0_g1_i1:288-602(-)